MRLLYNPEKAAQAAARLVKLHNGPINALVLMKLLYLADRKALTESGYTITGDAMVSMPHGPVLSRIYDCIQWNEAPWCDYITERDNHHVSLRTQEPKDDELSEYELDVLADVHHQYGRMGPWEIRRMTHNLPEYKDPNGSSLPIDPVEILRLAGKSDQEVAAISRDAENAYLVGRFVQSSNT